MATSDLKDPQQFMVRLPVEMHLALKEYADEMDLSMSQVVRRAVRTYLEKEAQK